MPKRRAIIIASSSLAVLLAAGTAFAAVRLYGHGTLETDASKLKPIEATNVHLTNTLVPGKAVSAAADLRNLNDFDVQASAVILEDATLVARGSDCDSGTLKLGGTYQPVPNGGGPGHQIFLTKVVTIPAGQTRTVAVPNVISQDSLARGLCGVKLDFTVLASVGTDLP